MLYGCVRDVMDVGVFYLCLVCMLWQFSMLHAVAVLNAACCGSSQCCMLWQFSMLYDLQFVNAGQGCINKLQVMQNAALRTATGCTQDTNIQHLHDETLTLPIHEHLQLHASQYKQKTQHTSHPLHKHTTYFNTPRLKKTLFLTTDATQQTFPQTPTQSLQQT